MAATTTTCRTANADCLGPVVNGYCVPHTPIEPYRSPSRIIVRGGCAHVLAGTPQCRNCAQALEAGR